MSKKSENFYSNYISTLESRKYTVDLNIYSRIKEIYKEFLSSIKIEFKNTKLKQIFDKVDVNTFVSEFVTKLFDNEKINIFIIEGFISEKNLLTKELISYKSLSSTLLKSLIFFFKINTTESLFNFEIKKIHNSRIVTLKNDFFTSCNILKKACENYERAILSASFVVEYTNHKAVFLGSDVSQNDNALYRTSLLALTSNTRLNNKFNEAIAKFSDTILSHQYGLSILGNEDRIESMANTYSIDSYNVLKRDLLAKSGIPEAILFGTSIENMSDILIKNFYEKVNKMFFLYVKPAFDSIIQKLGFFGKDLYEIKPLIFEDFSYKNKKIEVLTKCINLLNGIMPSEEKTALEKKILKTLEDLI